MDYYTMIFFPANQNQKTPNNTIKIQIGKIEYIILLNDYFSYYQGFLLIFLVYIP